MPLTIFPNQSGRSGLAPRPYARGRRTVASKQVLPMYQLRQHTTGDAYTITTTSSTLLRSTFVPLDAQKPMYELTTDVASGASATTILWKVHLASRSVKEVARVTWANSGSKTVVEMGGVTVPIDEFLTKPRFWRLGVSKATHSFTSQLEEYKWVPQPTLFNSESCIWHCIRPISHDLATGPSTLLAVYRPSTSTSPSSSRTGWRSSMSLDSIYSTTLTARQSSLGGKRRMPASLEMYPEVEDDGKPFLRDILVLTVLLFVTEKDEWMSLPHNWDQQLTTTELVLARLTDTD